MNNSAKIFRAGSLFLFGIFFLTAQNIFSQNAAATDSVIRSVLESQTLTGEKDKGVSLIKQDKLNEAGQFYNEEIKKNEADMKAFFGRGVVHWAQNDQASACRDWSAVVALGDTATLKLLDKNCHGNMVVEDDTIPSKKYHQMFGKPKADTKTTPGNSAAMVFAEEMPQFPGGEKELFAYLSKNVKYPANAKEKKIQGRVYVSFIVSSKGKVLFPHVERGIGGGCDEEALRVTRAMPPWKAGRQGGKPVPVKYTLPLSFKMK